MTGYGKAVFNLGDQNILVEIRSVNSKNSDVSIKTQLIPKEKEAEAKQLITRKLNRGSVDLFTTVDSTTDSSSKKINKELFISYYKQIREIAESLPCEPDCSGLTGTILRLPEVIESRKPDEQELWPLMLSGIEEALEEVVAFRKKEGERLADEICGRVRLIENYLANVENYEAGRIDVIRERILNRIDELKISHDPERLEQEMIFYIEKLDITEEKVRLAQHCKYFMEVMEMEEFPGKKLGFIAQEMGREINTLGSKANNIDIQKIVVNMKDELEKIKEQILNIL